MEEREGAVFSSSTSSMMNSEGDDFPEDFQCPVCLDLFYKPVVLGCGHVCCFWCTHMSMDGYGMSYCAICRSSYSHFPSICQTLYLLIRKICPAAYERRSKQVLEEEKLRRCFSPQFEDSVSLRSGGTASSAASQEVSRDDVLCPTCKKLLYRPVVLNCGHVCCESCMSFKENATTKCKVCRSIHPVSCAKVCLLLHQFIEKQFNEQYLERKEAAKQATARISTKFPNEAAELDSKLEQKCQNSTDHHIHYGVGCDTCGVYPISGKRYKCMDCSESIGFDLCDACYRTNSKLPGRFNQQHKPEHKFELIMPIYFEALNGLHVSVSSSEDHGPIHGMLRHLEMEIDSYPIVPDNEDSDTPPEERNDQ